MSASDAFAAFDAAVRAHDARVARAGFDIWVGSEPTFTDRFAWTPEWLHEALGDEKLARAKDLLVGLVGQHPNALVLRSTGRSYPGEVSARWSLGLYRRRDGGALWSGPPDPILCGAGEHAPVDLALWHSALAAAAREAGFIVVDGESASVSAPGDAPSANPRRAALDLALRIEEPPSTLRLRLSQDEAQCARLDLPHVPDVATFLGLLAAIERSAGLAGIASLVLAGVAPPVDATVEHTTVTPDPAVVEVNSAPSPDAADFLRMRREIQAAAEANGLASYRLYFNGTVADSGGGGQITLGGPTPGSSVFLTHPRLLPRLVAFVNRHPSLSYLHAHDYVGAGGQSVRADERGADAFGELALALHLLARDGALAAPWVSLAPFLCDVTGNAHRAEINIEKLWNPALPGRGQQGLVEFRAFRMQHTPEGATALACLLRAVVAMLARETAAATELMDWGHELHDRFALPFYLERDLDQVLAALDDAGMGLDAPIAALLKRDEFRFAGRVALPDGCALEVRRAVEFWPLIGDVAHATQGGTSRLVDASTSRLEIRLLSPPHSNSVSGTSWRDWRVRCSGARLPLRAEQDRDQGLGVCGLRYRSFVPVAGLHPTLGAQTPLVLELRHRAGPGLRITLHEWRADGADYPGVPADLAEAARRRADRIVLERIDAAPSDLGEGPAAPAESYCLDLRYLA